MPFELHQAAESGDLELVKSCIKNGAAVNKLGILNTDKDYLYYFIIKNYSKYDGNCIALKECGKLPVYYADFNNHIEVAQELINNMILTHAKKPTFTNNKLSVYWDKAERFLKDGKIACENWRKSTLACIPKAYKEEKIKTLSSLAFFKLYEYPENQKNVKTEEIIPYVTSPSRTRP